VCNHSGVTGNISKLCIKEGYLCSDTGHCVGSAGVQGLTPCVGRHGGPATESGVDGAHLTNTAGHQCSSVADALKALLAVEPRPRHLMMGRWRPPERVGGCQHYSSLAEV
jgi:hypothetical protein